jgi:DNA polymerase elongation subunit (family B)
MPNGVVIDQNKSDAIIADVIADIMTSREKYKKKMLQALADKKEDEAEVLDMNQRAVKVLNNAVYGVTANERFRLYDLRLAESITTAGQVIIRSSTYIMNEYANNLAGTVNKDYVITNDTDSIIFTLDGIINNSILPTERDPKILADIANYSKLCQEHVNESIYNIIKNVFYKYKVTKTNNFLMIKNEWLANAGLFVAKKNYVINMVFKEGVPYEKMKSTGISLRRSSTPKVLKPFLENVLGKILSFADNNEVNQLIVEECRKIKEDYSIRDIALPISVNDMDSYENLPVHIRGAKIWNDYYAPSDLNKITVGKVKYIYVKSWDKQELNLNKEYVISIPDTDRDWNYISDKIVIDYDKMRERLIIKPISIFYNALKWDIPTEIKTNNNGAFINMGTKISSKFKLI